MIFEKNQSINSISEPSCRLIDTVSFDGDNFVYEGVTDHGENDNDPIKDHIRNTIVDLYPAEKFHKTFCDILCWTGGRAKLSSLAVEHDDEALQAATEVVHRQLVSRLGHRVLARLDTEDAKDLLKLMFGFGPLVASVAKEVAEKKQMARKASRAKTVVENEGEEDGPERA